MFDTDDPLENFRYELSQDELQVSTFFQLLRIATFFTMFNVHTTSLGCHIYVVL